MQGQFCKLRLMTSVDQIPYVESPFHTLLLFVAFPDQLSSRRDLVEVSLLHFDNGPYTLFKSARLLGPGHRRSLVCNVDPQHNLPPFGI